MFNLRFATDYLQYRFKAKTRHGLHSPFVYRLVDEVIYDLRAKTVYPKVSDPSGFLKQAKIAHLLYRLTADLRPGNIIAMDATTGDTALYLKQAAPQARVFILKDDKPAIPETFDLILIANGTTENVLKHFESCLPEVHETTMMIINDIYLNEGMKAAWAGIKANRQVTATVDLFRLGLVFFRKGQVKEDFTILM